MKNLSEAEIIKMMREEWDTKLLALAESVDATLKGKVDGREKMLISPGLKLRNKVPSKKKGVEPLGYLYTVVSVSPRDVILQTPDGKQMLVDKETLENNYELD